MQAAQNVRQIGNSRVLVESRGVLTPGTGSLGVLLLHGFTSSLSAVNGILPRFEAAGLPYEMPVLRGHQGNPSDLEGVCAQDWYDDAFHALERLCRRVDRVVVVGLSMGGLVSLRLCAQSHECSQRLAGCVTWAPALGFCHPLAWMAKPLSRFIKTWRGQDSFRDPECRKHNENYATFPTSAFVALYDYAYETRRHLEKLNLPLCIIHSKRDQVVPYHTSRILFKQARSDYAELNTLLVSGHELGQDCEAETVFELTMDFVQKLLTKSEKVQN